MSFFLAKKHLIKDKEVNNYIPFLFICPIVYWIGKNVGQSLQSTIYIYRYIFKQIDRFQMVKQSRITSCCPVKRKDKGFMSKQMLFSSILEFYEIQLLYYTYNDT